MKDANSGTRLNYQYAYHTQQTQHNRSKMSCSERHFVQVKHVLVGRRRKKILLRYVCVSGSCVDLCLSEQGMQIHISQTTKDHLEHEPYIIEERGKIFVKVSADWQTFFHSISVFFKWCFSLPIPAKWNTSQKWEIHLLIRLILAL